MRPAPGAGQRRHRPRRRFGQHFLLAPWAQRVVQAIAPGAGDVFLEVGPGSGALTLPLARYGQPVLAVELDRDLVADLAAKAPPNVTLVSGDILKTDVMPYLAGLEPSRPPSGGPAPGRRLRVVGNLPYNLSTPILFRLLELQTRHAAFTDATIMLQREVADRLVARPGTKAYGVLTILVGLGARVQRLLDLPPGAFRPPPKVRSAVVRLTFQPPDVRVADPALLERLVKRMFSQRRKTLANALKGFVPDPPAALRAAGINPMRRPETLDLADLARLTHEVAGTRRSAVL